jgi:hypothetical protein
MVVFWCGYKLFRVSIIRHGARSKRSLNQHLRNLAAI